MNDKRKCGNCEYWRAEDKICLSPLTFVKLKTKETDFCKHYTTKTKEKEKD